MHDYNGRADLCLRAVQEVLGTKRSSSGPRRARGHGVACFMKSPVMRTNARSGAIIWFNKDGSATVFMCFGPDGRIQNWNLTDYRIPTSSDVPQMEVIFVETEDATGPYGARFR